MSANHATESDAIRKKNEKRNLVRQRNQEVSVMHFS